VRLFLRLAPGRLLDQGFRLLTLDPLGHKLGPAFTDDGLGTGSARNQILAQMQGRAGFLGAGDPVGDLA